jgi:hypothetical protein
MELLLNLIWLLLIVPAFLLWKSSRRAAGIPQASLQVLALACILALLFPVVSATDDIQAMRPESEEAGGRDALSSPHYSRFALFDSSSNSMALPSLLAMRPELRTWGMVTPIVAASPAANAATTRAGRAPPQSSLAQ